MRAHWPSGAPMGPSPGAAPAGRTFRGEAGSATGGDSSAGGFRVRLTRATIIDGRRFAAGAQLRADAEGALRLVRSGAAYLVDANDLQRLAASVEAPR
ncbi:MAG: hypothetical protein KIT17_15445 [Rubrivivax sp.]|nr:hypothetical protein [Rubrivivax sp.]